MQSCIQVNGYTYNSLWTSSILLERTGGYKRNIMTLKIKIAFQSTELLIYSLTSMIVSSDIHCVLANQLNDNNPSRHTDFKILFFFIINIAQLISVHNIHYK